MNNGAFFSRLRKFIVENSSIESLDIFTDKSHFPEVQTAVQTIILKKGEKSPKYLVKIKSPKKSEVIFAQDAHELSAEFQSRSTLWDLGYEANTGILVWNQNKENLRSNPSGETVALVWAHNIQADATIVLDETNVKKPQYVIADRHLVGPAIVVNRIIGSVGKGSLRCALVPDGFKFVGENHVNVIRRRQDVEPAVTMEELLDLLRAPTIKKRIQMLTGNTQLSCTELTHALPLDSSLKVNSEVFENTLF